MKTPSKPGLARVMPATTTNLPAASETPSLLVDIRETGKILGLTEWQVRGLIANGQLVVTKKVGTSFYFSRKYLASWAEKVAA